MNKTSNTTLGELVEFQRGFDLPKSEFIPGNVPVISSNGILGYHNCAKVKAPGITIGRSGTVGLPHFINDDFFPHNTSLFIKDFKGNNPKYIFYLLKTLKLNEYGSGSGVPTMNRNHLHPLKVSAYLSQNTQTQIAKVLSDLDAKIELNNKINEELEAMAKLIYDYWFVQFEFPFDFAQGKPNEEGKPYKSSGGKMVWNEELKREIPQGWEVKELSEIVSCNKWTISKGALKSKINYLDTSNLTFNKIDSLQVIDPDIEKIPSRAQRIIAANDILFSTVRPNQCHFGIIKKPLKNLVASSGFAQIRSMDKSISNDLLYFFLTSERTINRLQQIAETSVSAYPSISYNDILALKICLPKDEKFLARTNSTFDSINYKTTICFEENKKLSKLRDWLLPMLMNGQVKVSEL